MYEHDKYIIIIFDIGDVNYEKFTPFIQNMLLF